MKIDHIKRTKSIIKKILYYDNITNKQLTPDEKRFKLSKINEYLEDNEILLEYMKVLKNLVELGIEELEKGKNK